MTRKHNPFRPNAPVYTGVFAGRYNELKRIDEALYQTAHGNPTNMLIIGERGIGKSSLLLAANHFAKGSLTWDEKPHNFISVQIGLGQETTMVDLARKIKTCLNREIDKADEIVAKLKSIWKFLKKFEVGGVKYREGGTVNGTLLVDELAYSLADTVCMFTEPASMQLLGLRENKDGIAILIDEADSAANELDLGTFLKNLSETLIKEGCNNIIFILCGLPRLREVLRRSHESSLRLFEDWELSRLSDGEVKNVINQGLIQANQNRINNEIVVDSDALETIVFYSEGYPHFVQQVASSAFDMDTDNIITIDDVESGMFNPGGALDLIGDRYYRDLYYARIKSESYRQILKIMAQKWDQWVSKQEIRMEFSGNDKTLDNGIRALRNRNIILSKEGSRGQYRLQWKGFALWIRLLSHRESR